MTAILYPDPPLACESFVLRRCRARDFHEAVAAREESALQVRGTAAVVKVIRSERVDALLYSRLPDD
jgi:hypothetical protein